MDRPICFFSDYGYTDDFAGVCRAVIARLAPEVRVIDVTHGLPERDVLAGAVVLRNTLPYMPDKAVILAVVDPGVGGPRRPVALRSHGDHLFVGPDNGLLMHAADARRRRQRRVRAEQPGALAGPAVGHVPRPRHLRAGRGAPRRRARARRPSARRSAPTELDRIDLPEPRRHRDGLTAIAVLVDRFGNVALNLRARDLEKARLTETVELLTGGERYLARVARTFASVRASDIVVLIDSYGQASVAVNNGSAAEVLGLDAGDEVRLRRLG